MRRNVTAVFVLAIVLTACTTNGDTEAVPVEGGADAATSPTIATPVPLPFDNSFPNRWNDANNGSPFEPCNAFSDEELRRFQIDPAQIQDAAIVDGQGIRGCNWSMAEHFSLSSLVTNSESLAAYRAGTVENEWRPDLDISGRKVGLFTNIGDSSVCSTYVQSYSAAVVTNVVTSMSSAGRSVDACKLVEDFTRAYINKIPR